VPGGSPVGGEAVGEPAGPGSQVERAAFVPLVPSGPPPMPQRPVRWPIWLAVVLGIATLICVGVGAVAFRYYDKATQPNRSTPDVAVDNYLRAVLVNDDSSEAQKYSCVDRSALSTFEAFHANAVAAAEQLGDTASFSWTSIHVDRSAQTAKAAVTIEQNTFDGATQVASSEHQWRFTVLGPTVWRVCAALAES
jgi:hypothetical protein